MTKFFKKLVCITAIAAVLAGTSAYANDFETGKPHYSVAINSQSAVYNGTKEKYPNYPLYVIDGAKKAVLKPVSGQKQPEKGLMLELLNAGIYDEKSGVYGWKFPLGQTGLIALGDGYYYISKNGSPEKGVSNSTVKLYKWNTECENAPFELVTE